MTNGVIVAVLLSLVQYANLGAGCDITGMWYHSFVVDEYDAVLADAGSFRGARYAQKFTAAHREEESEEEIFLEGGFEGGHCRLVAKLIYDAYWEALALLFNGVGVSVAFCLQL